VVSALKGSNLNIYMSHLKKYKILIAACLFPAGLLLAQGQYAGSMKKLVGATYTDSRNIPALKTWQFNQGSVLSGLDAPEVIMAETYKKGTTLLAFISIGEPDTTNGPQVFTQMTIIDVIEIKNVAKGHEVKNSVCRQNKEEDMWIIALIKPAAVDYSKALKAWRFNRDKRKFQVISAKTVDCMNEGYEQF
jgi:hypothetical protein